MQSFLLEFQLDLIILMFVLFIRFLFQNTDLNKEEDILDRKKEEQEKQIIEVCLEV